MITCNIRRFFFDADNAYRPCVQTKNITNIVCFIFAVQIFVVYYFVITFYLINLLENNVNELCDCIIILKSAKKLQFCDLLCIFYPAKRNDSMCWILFCVVILVGSFILNTEKSKYKCKPSLSVRIYLQKVIFVERYSLFDTQKR